MARVAFYAPMKSPNHPVPSGDRTMARAIMSALESENYQVDLVSELRTYEGQGDPETQAKLVAQAAIEAERLIELGGWSAWVTYHNYYKAPDLLGPVVSAALGIPYVLVESTRASKRLNGPWDRFERISAAASDHASAIFYFTEHDRVSLEEHRKPGQSLVHLPPFLTVSQLPHSVSEVGPPNILAAGMMREGDKLASYRIIAQALPYLQTKGWRLDIAGDGPARGQVEELLRGFGDRVRFRGMLDKPEMSQAYQSARAFFWPGVNEAFGMVYLEAQAQGVPVVAQDRPGVRDVVPANGLVEQDNPKALAAALDRLLADEKHWKLRSETARDLIRTKHLQSSAQVTIWLVLEGLLKEAP